MDIYDKIFKRAKELGISKAHISTSLGLSRSWLNSARAYNTYLPIQTLAQIATILQTTTDDLIDGVCGYQIPEQNESAPTTKAEADRLIDLEIMMKYAQLRPEDRLMIDAMIERLLSQRER